MSDEAQVEISSFLVQTDDLQIHGLHAGCGQPLVLLHGWPEHSLVWKKCMRLLARDFEVWAPDLRGAGWTRKRDPQDGVTPTPDVLARDLEQMAAALGLRRLGVVSHDIGAWVAQSYARAHPSQLSGLFFFNCPYPGIGPRWAAPDHLKEVWYQYFHQSPLAEALVGHSRETIRIYLGHFFDQWSTQPGLFDADLEALIEPFVQGGVQGGFEWYRAIAELRLKAMKNLLPPVAPVEVATRFLWGRRDPILKVEWTDKLPQYFSNCEVEVADAGHFVHYERPDLAAARIRNFFFHLKS